MRDKLVAPRLIGRANFPKVYVRRLALCGAFFTRLAQGRQNFEPEVQGTSFEKMQIFFKGAGGLRRVKPRDHLIHLIQK